MRPEINLASRRHVNQRLTTLLFTVVIAALLAGLLFLMNGFYSDYQLAGTYRSHLSELKTQLHGEQPERIDPQEIAERKSLYNQAQRLLQRDAFRWTALFDRMEQVLPEGVSLVNFKPDYEKNRLEVNGLSRDLKTLQLLLDRLHQDRFRTVFLNNQGQAKVDDGRGRKRTVLTFSISLGGVF